MRAPTLLAVFVVSISVAYAIERHWEFGKDDGQDLIDYSVGEISYQEKFKTIQIKSTKCTTVNHVSVMVDNPQAVPQVFYLPEVKTVYIVFGETDYSRSIYVVIAKGRQSMPGCDPQSWSPTTPYIYPYAPSSPAVVPIPSALPSYYGK